MENTYVEKIIPSHISWRKGIMIGKYCAVPVQSWSGLRKQ